MEEIKKEDEKTVELIDFAAKLVKPHTVISRVVDESDMPRVMEDAHIMYNICYTQCGLYPGAVAVAHAQITKKDPLRFFVTMNKEIIINPRILRHSSTTMDNVEGCVTFSQVKMIPVPRWYKCEVEYETIDSEGKIIEIQKSIKGREAFMYQHEINHCDGINIYGLQFN
jgi:peptide deformylase